MAKCRLCKKDITDGIEYCEDCLEKKTVLTNESYLDSLLNSVKNDSEPIRNYKKPQEPRKPEPEKTIDNVNEDREDRIDPADLADFDQFNLNDDLEDHITITDEELFGSDLDSPQKSTDISVEDLIGIEPYLDGIEDEQDVPVMNADIPMQELQDDFGMEVAASMQELQDDFGMEADDPMQELQDDFSMDTDDSLAELQDNIDPDLLTKFSDSAMEEEDEVSYDPALGELLSGFGSSEEKEEKLTEEEEFLSLLGQFGMDDPVASDVQAITELLNNQGNGTKSESMPSDVGEVFSDALTAVSGLEDMKYSDFGYPLPEAEPVNQKEKNKKAKSKDKGKSKDIGKPKSKEAKPTKGTGFFGKLFGNVVDEEQVKEAKKNKASEESAATKEKIKAKGKKAKNKASSEENDETKDSPKKAVAGKEISEETKGNKKDKAKKPKKEKKKAAIELIDDYNEIEGRINRLGATVVFTFFGLMVALLLIGTSLFTYSLSIKNATKFFDRQKYTEAYNEVYGIELRDEDIELYEKIMTVMFVNKQLNSYNNYFAMKKYPEALDSLLKGLKRYDKYIELATMLGIKSDLDYVRDQIMAELEYAYMLSEKDAEDILSIENQKAYSIAVYNAVLENMQY